MNRQSVLVFADFHDFESPRGSPNVTPRGSPRNSVDWGAESSSEEYEKAALSSSNSIKSSGSSTYSLDKNLPEPPYHVFTLAKKKQLVYIVSLAGLFSPLSSNIYFPALGQISTVCRLSAHTAAANVP